MKQQPFKSSNARGQRGFSLVECVFAMLMLMIGSLGIVSVLVFSFRSNADAKKRYNSLMLAQRRIEDVRNTPFISLTAGTVTENSVLEDGVQYRIVRVITDNDLNTAATAPGPETKTITVTVSPLASQMINDQVSLTTVRMVNRPGPNRLPNS